MSSGPHATKTSGDTVSMNTPSPYDRNHDFPREQRDYYLSNPSIHNSTGESFSHSPAPTINSRSRLASTEKQSGFSSDQLPVSAATRPPRSRSWIVAGVVILILILVVTLPVGLTLVKSNHHETASDETATGNGTTGGTTTPPPTEVSITGGDGSTITTDDGSTFTYSNKFGGFWVSDPNNPFNNNAQPNSWTPPLNQTWDFNQNKIYGVNLGGLFVLEPFISPALFQKYPGAIDEWTLSVMMAADPASGGLNQLEEHYKTFITEKDIAEIAGAGLNWVRVPIPFWAIDSWPGEPFLAKTSWRYFVRLLGWCRKYGLRVSLDLHTIPGSQNGYNHSGKFGQVNFLRGTMGLANAERTLNYIRIIAEFISQPQWKDVVPVFGIMNEPIMANMGVDQLRSFYIEAHRILRSISGYGAGKGPYLSFHDGFFGPGPWADFFRGADRVMMDVHPYFAFSGGPNTDPISNGTGVGAGGIWPANACRRWGGLLHAGRSGFGITVAGEWSNGWNDCGLFLDGVGDRPTYGGNCADWEDSANWDAPTKAGILQFAAASMDSLDQWFFWTWKIGKSTRGIVESPLWSYQLGLEGGWMPKDPRSAVGTCDTIGVPVTRDRGNYPTWMTGGAGAGPAHDAARYPWPPVTILAGGTPAEVPRYTATGTIATLSPPAFTARNGDRIEAGSGWFNSQDNTPAPTPIQGCTYPNAWDGTGTTNFPLCRNA